MRVFLLVLSVFMATLVTGQAKYIIKGKVISDNTREPISGASIFVSNSSKGTTSHADGSFELQDVPPGKHQLIVSLIGHTTMVIPYTNDDLPLQLEVKMKRKPVELASVTVEPDEANGWQKWGKFFMESFIGTTANAGECKLKNPQALRFKHSRKNGTLTVLADEPLIIENKALGYELEYQLEEFNFDFRSRYLVFLGYPLFRDMNDSGKTKAKWARNREKAYNGSLMHFMKSLYDNRVAEEGYQVRRLRKEQNVEKKRVRNGIQERLKAQRASVGRQNTIDFGDSTEYFNRILRQPDEFDVVSSDLLTADSLMTSTPGNEEKTLFFDDYLLVIYTHEKEEKEYLMPDLSSPKKLLGHQQSTIFLINQNPVNIDKRGNHSPILDLISFGYWAWSEKIANLLPIDYQVRQPAITPR